MNDEYRTLFRGGFKDDRIKVLIAMAPGNHYEIAEAGVGSIDIPVFLMTASGDQRCPNETQGDPYWEELQGDHKRRINFPTGGHHSFILTCGFAPAVGENDGCGEGFIDYLEALRLVNIYGLAFIRHHLYGDTSVQTIVDGTEMLSDEITFSSK
jgi:predicted dienelactone hydrolase